MRAAMPMYASFDTTPSVTPFNVIKPMIDVNAKNTKDSYGAKESSRMNFKEAGPRADVCAERDPMEEHQG